jgi:chromosome segregation ATPase
MSDEPKTFTQDELNEKIEARLARLKKQYDEETAQDKAELVRLKAEAKTAKDAAETAARTEIETLKTQIDPVVLDLLPEKLSLPDQLEWLKKASGQLPKQDKMISPKTPRPKEDLADKFKPLPVSRKLV